MTIGFPESRTEAITRLVVALLVVPWFLCMATVFVLKDGAADALARVDPITREFADKENEIIIAILAAALATAHDHSSPTIHIPRLNCTNGFDARIRTLIADKIAPSRFKNRDTRQAAELLEKFISTPGYMVDSTDCAVLEKVLLTAFAPPTPASNSLTLTLRSSSRDSTESQFVRQYLESRLASPDVTNIVSLLEHQALPMSQRFLLASGNVPLVALTHQLFFALCGLVLPIGSLFGMRSSRKTETIIFLGVLGLLSACWVGSHIWENAGAIGKTGPVGISILAAVLIGYLASAWATFAIHRFTADRWLNKPETYRAGDAASRTEPAGQEDHAPLALVGILLVLCFAELLVGILFMHGRPLLVSAMLHDFIVILNLRHLGDGYLQLVAVSSVLLLVWGAAAMSSCIHRILQKMPDYRRLDEKGVGFLTLIIVCLGLSYVTVTAAAGNVSHKNTQELISKPLQQTFWHLVDAENYKSGGVFYKRRYMSASTEEAFENWTGRLRDRALFFPQLWSSLLWSSQTPVKNLALSLLAALYCLPLVIEILRCVRRGSA